jgi:sec-independent protein translocase protein TatC
MADEPAAEPLDAQSEEEGGPVKSFLEHLEDLRWVLIKSCSAAGVAILACLLGGNYLMQVLEWPLHHNPAVNASPIVVNYVCRVLGLQRHQPAHQAAKPQTVRLFFGTNQLSELHPASDSPLVAMVGTNRSVRVDLVPTLQGTNHVLAWQAQADPDPPARGLNIQIINLSPAGSFIVATKAAFYGGLVLASPFIFYFLAHFIFPALKLREKKYIYRGLAFGGGLFTVGVSFCYFILMPVALSASVQYAEWLGITANQWRAEDYVAFVCKFMLGMGIGFELPVVVLTLVKIGVLSYRTLAKGRPYVIVISAVLGAVLTTPEIITQILMAVPLYMLYETCIWIAWYWDRKEKKLAEQASGDTVAGT